MTSSRALVTPLEMTECSPQVAIKHYKSPSTKALTPALHSKIESFFQSQHGDYAGWAQAYLFYSNSKKPEKHPNDNLATPEQQPNDNLATSVETKQEKPEQQPNDNLATSVEIKQENVDNGTVVKSSKKRNVKSVKPKVEKRVKVENEKIWSVKSVVKRTVAPSRVSCRTINRLDYFEGKIE